MLLKKLSKAAAVCAVMGMALAMVSCGDRNDGTYLTHEALEDESLKLGGKWKLTGGYVYEAELYGEEHVWCGWDEEGDEITPQKVTDLRTVARVFENYVIGSFHGGSSSDDSEDSALHFDNSLCLTLTDAQAKKMLKSCLSYIDENEDGFAWVKNKHQFNTPEGFELKSFDGDVKGYVRLSADHARIDMYSYFYYEAKTLDLEEDEEIFDGVKDEHSFTLTRQS